MRLQPVVFLVGVLWGASAFASQEIQQCILDASARYKVHPYLIWSIAKTESSFRPGAVARNADGSEDVGIMQVNSWWLERRKSEHQPKRLGDYGVTRTQLLDACTNIHAGTWVLAQNMKLYGNTWKAVGAYNAVTPWKQARYVQKVQKNLRAAMSKMKQKAAQEQAGVRIAMQEVGSR